MDREKTNKTINKHGDLENHIYHKALLQYLVYLLGADMHLFVRFIKLGLLQNVSGVRQGRSTFNTFNTILLAHFTLMVAHPSPPNTHISHFSFCSIQKSITS